MKSLKKIAVSFLVVLAMSCTMIATWAAGTGTNEIIRYTVQTSTNGQTWVDADVSNVVISSAQMLKVDVTLQSAGDVTLMSYKYGATSYDNSNIQYVAQETAGNTTSIQFRPRNSESFGAGVYVVKIGAEGVSTPVSFNYVVEGDLTVTANNNNICKADGTVTYADVTYTIDGLAEGTTTVAIDGKELTAGTDYTISENTLTIKPEVIDNKTLNSYGSYDLTVSQNGKTGYSMINVCPAVTYKNGRFGVTGDVCAAAIPDGMGYKIPLKPYRSELSKNDTKVTHIDNLFIGWQDKDNKVYTVNKDGAYITYTDACKELTAQYDTEQNGDNANDVLTITGYQKIQYQDNENNVHNAIRFVALIDTDKVSISNITSAGFVVSDICLSPTKEGGFASTSEGHVYNSIKARADVNDISNQNVANIIDGTSILSGKYDCIITSVLDIDADNNYQINQKIGAVAYIEYTDGTDTHVVYGGKGTPKSYSELSN